MKLDGDNVYSVVNHDVGDDGCTGDDNHDDDHDDDELGPYDRDGIEYAPSSNHDEVQKPTEVEEQADTLCLVSIFLLLGHYVSSVWSEIKAPMR